MRILIVSTFFPPLNSIASLRPYTWAKYWTLEGHDVTVLTTQKQEDPKTALSVENPGFKALEVPALSFLNSLKTHYQPKNGDKKESFMKIFFHFLRFKKGILNACRMPDLTAFWVPKALRAIQKEKPWDVVISSSGPYTVHLVAEKLKRQGLAKKWVADYRDTWSDNYIYPGIFPLNCYERYLEKKLLLSSDLITTISEPFAREFRKKHKKTVLTIENGYEASDFQTVSLEKLLPDDGKYRIIHTGSLYLEKRDPTPLFKAIDALRNHPLLQKLEVLFVGDRQANLEHLIDRFQVASWVKPYGFVNHETALKMQQEAHALLFLPWNDPSIDGVLSGKIFEYLASGSLILAACCPSVEASQQLIVEAKAGHLLPTQEKIQAFLLEKLANPQKEKVSVDPSLLLKYDRKVLAKKLLQHL